MHKFSEYLYEEISRGYILRNDQERYIERRERFYAFIKVPFEFEKFMLQAYIQITDSFLYPFTLLPIRFLLTCKSLLTRSLKPAEICDLLKGLILILSTLLISYIDMSILYHIVKSQSVIKLYIFFNMLEVFDKLMSTLGCDVLDTLFWTATEPVKSVEKWPHRFRAFYCLLAAICYVIIHGLLVLLQATTLNVALNSKNKALLTIMMSNNFVELKGMVFKKFEKNNLFHMSCSDVRERHHFLVLLIIVMLQTLKQYNWNQDQFYILLPDCVLILASEMVVDWFKHAFVTRFNEINCEVYREYTVSLAYDLISSKLKRAYADHSDLVSRRMGFIPLPLAALVIRVMATSFTIDTWRAYLCLFLAYLVLLTFKIVINIVSLGNSSEIIQQERELRQPKMPQRQCASLPSSRHASSDNVSKIVYTKSQPQSPRVSLTDITNTSQDNLERSMIFSDSTVHLQTLSL